MSEPTASSAPAASNGEALVFNPFDPAFRSNPTRSFRACVRRRALRGPLGMPVLSRYADCVAMLRHAHASSDSRNSEMYEHFQAQQVNSRC